MKLSVLYFSTLRGITGCEQEEIETKQGSTVTDILTQLYTRHDGLKDWDEQILVAVDLTYAERDLVLAEGQEVAIMPPVQGG